MKLFKSIIISLTWVIYITYGSYLFLFRWFKYNLFPKDCPFCLHKTTFYGYKYEWDINPSFKPTKNHEKYPYDFLVCEHCEKYYNLDIHQ